jgi:2'-5' RNA ligase
MLDVAPIMVGQMVADYSNRNLFDVDGDLYYSNNPARFWIKGAVAEKGAHMTVLFGLLEKGLDWKDYVDTVLDGWLPESIEIEAVDYFDGNWPDEQYYCVIGHVKVTDSVTEGNQRLRLLPHVDTFPNYRPHVTLGYIKRDPATLDQWIKALDTMLAGTKLEVTKLNYGGDKG